VYRLSTEVLTLLGVHQERAIDGFSEMVVLPGFSGVVVHDAGSLRGA
jgi:hypothetical protein